jgi:hypothetical protein
MKCLRVALLGTMIVAVSPFAAAHSTAAENDKDVLAGVTKEVSPVISAPADTAAPPVAIAGNVELKSRAQEFIKKVPKDFLLNTPQGPRVSPKNPGGGTILLEEIQVIGKFDPADYVAPKPAPMLVFRASLEGSRSFSSLSTKEITDMVLCRIGLCPLLNADGLPIADTTPEQRAEARLNTPFTPTYGRGTLQ